MKFQLSKMNKCSQHNKIVIKKKEPPHQLVLSLPNRGKCPPSLLSFPYPSFLARALSELQGEEDARKAGNFFLLNWWYGCFILVGGLWCAGPFQGHSDDHRLEVERDSE